jgi:hypothetical protein
MRLSNAKLAFLCCVFLVFVAGYAREEISGLYNSALNWRSSDSRNYTAAQPTPTDDSSESEPKISPPPEVETSGSDTGPAAINPPIAINPRTRDIDKALEGVGPGSADENLVNQRQEYLKNLNSQLKEQHGGVLPSTTTTIPLPEDDTPPSPDLLPQNIPNMSVPGESRPGWVEPPPQLQQFNPPTLSDESDIEDPEESGDDEDLEPEEDEEADTAEDDEEDTTEDIVE